MNNFCLIVILILVNNLLAAQQIPDSTFQFKPVHVAYPKMNGPTVYIDEAHNNFHTLSTRYFTFGEVLKNDGYHVKPFNKKFSTESLKDCKILVIANALPDSGGWILPTPSAQSTCCWCSATLLLSQ
jgi:hypothetical protein